jgi:hypothetical protein
LVDEVQHAIGKADYLEELLNAAKAIGLDNVSVARGSILSYPNQISFGEAGSIRLGRRALSTARPSAVAAILKRERDRVSSVSSDFLRAVARAYFLITKPHLGVSVSISEIYALLTLLPGSGKEYTEADFARDIGILKESGDHLTDDGHRISFPASTSARLNQGHPIVTSDGRADTLASIRFDRVDTN